VNKTHVGIISIATAGALGLGLYLWKYQEWIAIPKARAPLMTYLKDPASAQFRNERIVPSGALCGEVNSKNSMGGYVGFKRYILAGTESNYLEDAGTLGRSSTADIIFRLDEETAIIRRFVDFRKENPGFPVPSESERAEIVAKNFFDHKWKALCAVTDA
jgi:hypothetical protein